MRPLEAGPFEPAAAARGVGKTKNRRHKGQAKRETELQVAVRILSGHDGTGTSSKACVWGVDERVSVVHPAELHRRS